MNELESKFNAKYSRCLSNFETMSIDTSQPNKPPLCSDTHYKSYNFDEIVKEEYPDKHPASPDTLIIKNNKVYCVEFKNLTRKKVNRYKKNLQEKLQQGTEVLLKILDDLSIKPKNLKFIFCVVYKESKNKYTYASNIENKVSHFGLKDADKYDFYQHIYTQPVTFFRQQFIDKIDKNLPC